MKLVKQRIFDRGYVRFVFDWVCPHPSDFPNVDLAICDNVASSRCQMAVHARAYAIDGLTDIDRDLIEIAEHVAANFVCEGANGRRLKARSIAMLYSAAISSSPVLALSNGSRICPAMCLTTGTHTPSPQT